MSDEDAVLVRRTLAGDRAAFEALIASHLPRARAVARSVLGEDPAVDDALQESFLRAYNHLGQLGDPATFPAWLCVIVRNEAVTWLRRHARSRAQGLEQAEELSQREIEAENPRLPQLRCALEALSPSYREIIALKYESDLSYEQIAETLDTTVANVEKRLYRARQQILAFLENHREGSSS
jgi:RNA polymerase sigma-70 factor (ECF subfamily)